MNHRYGHNRIRHQGFWPWWRWLLTALNILALALSAVLSWHYIEGGPMAGCGGGSPCDRVLNSRWSTAAGVLPVSGLAMGVYLAMIVAGLFIGRTTEGPIERAAWSAMLALAGTIAGSAVWFIIVQKWIVGEFCLYCMSTHITGLLLAVLVIWRAVAHSRRHSNDIPSANRTSNQGAPTAGPGRLSGPLPTIRLTLIGFALAGILAAVQLGFTPSSVQRFGESENSLPPVDYHTIPMVGSPDAPTIVTLLFDYECPHCQQLHLMLDEAIRKSGGKLAFALYPTPLNTGCNPYVTRDEDAFKNSCELAKIGLAVWVANRAAFTSFDDWMFTYDSGDSWRPRTPDAGRAKAVESVGRAKFEAACADPWIEQYLQTCIRVYGQSARNGNGGVPKMIFGTHWVIPEPHNADDLIVILQKKLGVPGP
ncbi:MAG TPA: vitamin K epoxide reductase family protein [Bacteroidota bacterium]|nr:vitamin K epoxide reductase family protein [Bacteroidota bacterium]